MTTKKWMLGRIAVVLAGAVLAAACGDDGGATPSADLAADADLTIGPDLALGPDLAWADCDSCTDGSCVPEKKQCFEDDPGCIAYNGCLGACDPTDFACQSGCDKGPGVTPAGIADFKALAACMDNACSSICN